MFARYFSAVAAAALLVMSGVGNVALAQSTANVDATCSSVRGILDAPSLDRAKLAAIHRTIERIYVAMDQENLRKGRTAIFERMNKDGRLNAVIMATANCIEHPSETLRQSAIAVYRGTEAFLADLGAND